MATRRLHGTVPPSRGDSIGQRRVSPNTVSVGDCEINGGVDLGENKSVVVLRLIRCADREVDELWTGGVGGRH